MNINDNVSLSFIIFSFLSSNKIINNNNNNNNKLLDDIASNIICEKMKST